MGGEEQLERFDVSAANVDEADHFGMRLDEEPGEAAQRVVGDIDGRRSHRHRQLIDISPGSDRQQRRMSDYRFPVAMTNHLDQAAVEGCDGAHLRTPAVASMSSAARRYSSASQSSARWR